MFIKNFIFSHELFPLGPKTKPVLVDPPTSRRQVVEPEQLSHRHDSSARRSRGHPRAHTLQGHLLPHLGGSLLVIIYNLYIFFLLIGGKQADVPLDKRLPMDSHGYLQYDASALCVCDCVGSSYP